MRKVLQTLLALFVLSGAFLGGFGLSALRTIYRGRIVGIPSSPRSLRSLPAPQERENTARADDDIEINAPDSYRLALAAIQQNYFAAAGDLPATTTLTYAAIDGMLNTIGDPYTVFWTPKEYRENMETNSGDFVGIGARLDVTKDHKVIIAEPMENSPAMRAGLLAGDVITAVDGKPVIGLNVDDVIDKIHGPEGSGLKITVQRGDRSRVFGLIRAIVHTRIVDYRMVDPVRKIGYIQLGMFNEQADIQFDAALQKLESQGLRSLVFDLRDNPGGLLQIAQDLASRFARSGPIVWVKEKSGRLSSLDVESDKHRSPLYRGAYPVVVLVNGDSASASEIVAGAIQDSGTGTLLGTRTYGKGLVQTIMPLADDSAVKITTQHYFTRNKHDINIKRDLAGNALGTVGGIKPDIAVDFSEHQQAVQRAAQASSPADKTIGDRFDPQLQQAITYLNTKGVTKTASR